MNIPHIIMHHKKVVKNKCINIAIKILEDSCNWTPPIFKKKV